MLELGVHRGARLLQQRPQLGVRRAGDEGVVDGADARARLEAAVVPGHPEACSLAESLMSELVGVPVTERCDKGERPRCCFEVPLTGPRPGGD